MWECVTWKTVIFVELLQALPLHARRHTFNLLAFGDIVMEKLKENLQLKQKIKNGITWELCENLLVDFILASKAW